MAYNNYRRGRRFTQDDDSKRMAFISSIHELLEVRQFSFDDSDIRNFQDAALSLNSLVKLMDPEEQSLTALYLECDSSPGEMARRLGCTPQYINRRVNNLISVLRGKI